MDRPTNTSAEKLRAKAEELRRQSKDTQAPLADRARKVIKAEEYERDAEKAESDGDGLRD